MTDYKATKITFNKIFKDKELHGCVFNAGGDVTIIQKQMEENLKITI